DSRYFEYPMLKRIAESARAVIVHNPAAARMVAEHAPGTAVIEIPHLFEQPQAPKPAEVEQFRKRLGFGPEVFIFAVLGFIREPKRLIQILEAFAAVRRENKRAALLVAGSFASAELERAAGTWLTDPGVARLPYLTADEFWLAASAVDACINLRYPAAGE